MTETKEKVKVEAPTSVMLLPNGHVRAFGGDDKKMSKLRKGWLVMWLESLEAKGINPLEIGRIEAVVNGELVRIKPFKKEGQWGYSTHVLDLYSAWQYERRIELNRDFSLIGFDSEDEMVSWIKKWNSADGEDAPPFFKECGAYNGTAKDCKPKEEWLERAGEMQSPHEGHYWYRNYDGGVYCKNHYGWAFENALKVIGNPAYIIVLDKSKIGKR